MFDIDKLFLSGITYTVVDGKAKSEFATTNVNYWRNTLIRDQISLLINKDENENPYNIQQLHGSIDNDTDLLLKVVDELSGNETVQERMPYDDYVLSTETSIKNDLVTGKVGIGPFALNNNNHVLTTLYGVELTLKRDHILSRNGFVSLHDYTDRDGNSILSWLSGLINAHVDIAKDSYISKLNVNPFTYNLVNLLVRLGLGKTTFYFTRQPILKELAVVVSNAKGISGNDKSMSQSAIVRQAEENYIKNLIAEYVGTDASSFKTLDDALDVLKDDFKKKGISVTKIQDQLLKKGDNVLRDVAKNSSSVRDTGEAMVLENKKGHYTINNMQLQLIVYLMYKEFEPVANNLAKLVKYSKIDTKKQGTTLAEQQEYETGYNDVLYGKTSRMFKNVDKMMLQSYIDTKTQESISIYRTILKSMLFEATKGFQDAVSIVLNEIGEANTQNIQLIKQVYNSVMFSIKSKFINSYANRNGINIKELVSGDNTMFDRLGKLRIALRTDPKYADLIDQNGEITNPLIAALVTAYSFGFDEKQEKELSIYHTPEDTYPNAKFIKLLNFQDDEQLDSNSLTTAWQELLEDNNRPELQQFARDLIVYAFITSGDVGGVKNLFRFVPMSWKKDTSTGQSYENFMAKALKLFQKNPNKIWDYIDTDDIILNNWKEYAFMPTMKYSVDKRKQLTPIYTVNVVQNDTPYYDAAAIVTDLVENDGKYSTTFGSKPPRYFKIKRGNDLSNESQRSYAIYKHAGVGLRPIQVKIGDTFVSRLVRYNIYQLVDPKGNQYRKGFRILEYGRSDASDNEFSQKIEKNPVFGSNEFAPNSFSEFVEQIEALKQHPQFGKLNPIYSQDDAYSSVLDIVNDIERNERVSNIEIIESTGFYTREDVEKDQGSLYIFTDNTDRDSGSGVVDPESDYAQTFGNGRELHYPTVTSAVIRGLDNACPISTQRYYHEGAKYEAGNWSDEDIEEFKSTIDFEIEYIKSKWQSGNYTRLILPEGGFFKEDSISNLSKHPQLAEYLESKLDELYSFVYGDGTTSDLNIDQHPNTTPAPGPETKINIYAGAGENADLSNFAIRPFTIKGSVIGAADSNRNYTFDSVEHAFQAAKTMYSDADNRQEWFDKIQKAKTPAEAHSLGRQIPQLDSEDWNMYSSEIMKDLIKASFEQNPQALQRLLDTGNATLTHNGARGKWLTEFPKLLMEVRDELRRNNSEWDNSDEFSDEEMNHCKH